MMRETDVEPFPKSDSEPNLFERPTEFENDGRALSVPISRPRSDDKPYNVREINLDRPTSYQRPRSLRPDGREIGDPVFPIGTLINLARRQAAPEVTVLSPQQSIDLRRLALKASANEDMAFAELDVTRACMELHVDPDMGLSSNEAAQRLEMHGPNELEAQPPPSFWEVLLDQFKDVVVIILLIGAIVSLGLGEYEAGAAILVIVAFNAFLGVKMEISANAALTDLKSANPPTCEVIRDGQVKEIPSSQLVPGDLVILALGKKIPADLRLIVSSGLSSNEMPLTGESVPTKKDASYIKQSNKEAKEDESESGGKAQPEKEEELNPRNLVFMGCLIETGNGRGVVIHTGMKTRMGSIQRQLSLADEDISPLAKKLTQLGTMLGIASITISLVVFLLMGLVLDNAWLDALLVAVSLTVAAVPEGLPVCVTIALAVGMRTMAVVHKAQILKLKSVETLGSASVICTDKTGTLTKGEMTAVSNWMSGRRFKFTGTGYDPVGFVLPEEQKSDEQTTEVEEAAAELKDCIYLLPTVLGALCSNAILQYNEKDKVWEASGNISERPLVVAAHKAGFKSQELRSRFPRIKENPFSSMRKLMSTLHHLPEGSAESNIFGGAAYVSIVKGAPNVVLRCSSHIVYLDNSQKQPKISDGVPLPIISLDLPLREIVTKQIDDYSDLAFRCLAIAFKTFDSEPEETGEASCETGLTLCGLIASIDPDRPEVKPAIQQAREAGIRTVMITGDYVKTAKAIAENIAILPRNSENEKAVDCALIRDLGKRETDCIEREKESRVLGGHGLAQVKADLRDIRTQLDAITAYADVYARAKPEDKITIVRSLQRQGNICSMTGDGVNDAPALKQANIGVAMGMTGTDVAKSAADMILLDDNFVSIIAAIRQGRIIYANIQKFCYFLLSTNIAEVFFMIIAVAIGLQAPLVPLQILWLNLCTDGAPAVALAVEAAEPGVMQEGPRPKEEPLLSRLMVTGICIQTVVLTCCSLFVYIVGLHWRFGSAWDKKFEYDRLGAVIPAEDNLKLREAQTMCILFITFAELARAYGARSLRNSVFQIGPFSNWYMQPACAISVICTIGISIIPGVQDIFGMVMIRGQDWGFVLAMACVPFTIDELTKVVYRATGFGKRPYHIDHGHPDKLLVKTLSAKQKDEEGKIYELQTPPITARDFTTTMLNTVSLSSPDPVPLHIKLQK
eukprot:gb/GEZN01000770.1/.p1 GENE.gb/GEZN01000770.1/~~gb/GEZN01000770.1/.p1  ORF type:complete len:1195 (+),score=139.50 gb/GEZN01000770.1/:43-3627(+)